MSAVDVDEILEHRLNANMHSMPYDVYSELFDSIDALGTELDRLQSENAKLRDLMHERASRRAIDHMTEDELRIWATNLYDRIDELEAENAKLRESVSNLLAQRDERLATAETENAKLRELCADMYCLCFESELPHEVAWAAYEKYEPCELCHERHGGRSVCAGTAEDMSETCCIPYQAEVVAACLRELGIEVG